MALELSARLISRLVTHNYAANVKGAKRFIERNRPEVWEVLEEVIDARCYSTVPRPCTAWVSRPWGPVLLNAARYNYTRW